MMPGLTPQDAEAFARMADDLRLAAAELRCRTIMRCQPERHPAERLEAYAAAIARDLSAQHWAASYRDHGALKPPPLASMQ